LKYFIIYLLLITSLFSNTSTWIQQKSKKDANGYYQKDFLLLEGTFPKGIILKQLHNPTLQLRHIDGEVFNREFINGKIPFNMPYKGSYHIFLQDTYVENDTLYINLYKTRIYNKDGDIQDAILKEIRGKTVGMHYGKEPFDNTAFEMIIQKPIKQHHINCCLYSGDILPIKLYLYQKQQNNIPIKVTTQKGWVNEIIPNKKGDISFEIPRNTYTDITKKKRLKETMLLEATKTIQKNGNFHGQPYSKVIYYTSIPLEFTTSPLEYSSKTAGFYVVIGVMLVFSLGLYYNRRKKKKTPKEIWFDEN
jgi:hypothetical protein